MKKFKITYFLFVMLMASWIILSNVNAAEQKTITTAEELANAINSQQEGETWIIKEGEYNLTQDLLDKYSSWQNTGDSSQPGWYFPIHKNNITIKGEGKVLITSDVEKSNGAWSTQDFVSVWGNNVTIDGVDFKCKKEVNKVIEVMGKNFTLKNCDIEKVDTFSGSIAFNSDDIGNAKIENVTLDSWINANYSKTGTLTTSNVTIDFTNNECAGEEGYLPVIKAPTNGTVQNSNFNLYVDSKTNLTQQVFTDKLPEGTTVHLTEDTTVDEMLNIKTSNVTLDLGGHKLAAADNFKSTSGYDAHLLEINSNNVIIKNGSIVTNNNKNAINIYNSNDITLENLKIDHTKSFAGSPIAISDSSVKVQGNLYLTIGDNSWYGISVESNATHSNLEFVDGSTVSMTGDKEKEAIYLEGNSRNTTIKGAIEAGLEMDDDGNYIIKEGTEVDNHQTQVNQDEKDDTPKTGIKNNNNNIMFIVSILAITFIVAIALKKFIIKKI